MAKRRIINGGFQDAKGTPLAAGYMTFRLSTDVLVGTTQVSAELVIQINLDSGGNVDGTVLVWPNDQMSPATAIYNVIVYTAAGEITWKNQMTIPSGVGSYDLNSWVPTNT